MIIMTILSLLLSNAVTLRRDISILFNRIVIIALIYCILHDTMSLSIISKGVGLHGGLLHITNITQVFQIFIFLISILILQLTSFDPIKKLDIMGHPSFSMRTFTSSSGEWPSLSGFQYRTCFKIIFNKSSNVEGLPFLKFKVFNKEHLKIIEYPLILLFVICGAVFLMSTNDLVSIFLSIELQSYGLYILSTIYRNSELSTTGGLIYFLLGGFSSCFILLGASLLYANSGTTSLDGLYIINSISDVNDNMTSWYKSYYLNFSLLIFSVGFLFKVSAAPFHFWSPDVYDAIPTIVTTFVAIIAKISIFILLLELVYHTNNYLSEFSWIYGLLVSSFLSLIIGTVVGLTQFRIKRLLAYSTISHLGFILLALSVSTRSVESTQAFIFYLIQYSFSNLNVFIILITIGFSLYGYVWNNKEYKNLLDINNSPVQLISQLKGYFYLNPLLSLSLAITIFSFAGIPPLVGFFAKQMVLSAALDNGYIFLSLIAILTSVVGAVYYLNIIKEIFFYSPGHKLKTVYDKNTWLRDEAGKEIVYDRLTYSTPLSSGYTISSPFSITISIITIVILLFIFMNREWLSMGTILVQVLFST
ncbi:putative NADH dehydrogenase subunit 2 [Sordaria macrospora k-hell]|uniref:NADH-ubiquinone oxidoreductase chain 2 n=1 Tax=Sordaria macrospora (strain ATCC MYA-333 / DSM 997 / K(L3346) / K-hell) TaxID=771870 RepID=F7WD21_SORMK|nr:LOW QUALITY PROTEIN: putative NADH dehydrogenase subunit 2 [Sordaria macrospora k-hell]CCC14768.1 putative NADH dehydrogenase subunit 2 [Sordaria macrospora k-hell]